MDFFITKDSPFNFQQLQKLLIRDFERGGVSVDCVAAKGMVQGMVQEGTHGARTTNFMKWCVRGLKTCIQLMDLKA